MAIIISAPSEITQTNLRFPNKFTMYFGLGTRPLSPSPCHVIFPIQNPAQSRHKYSYLRILGNTSDKEGKILPHSFSLPARPSLTLPSLIPDLTLTQL